MTLDARKGRILHAIVNEYVETADPIGSEWLVHRYDFGCKSATLRNEMSEMSDRGYLLQPHTSAGRIPSDRGYRYYVDNLMPPPAANAVPPPDALNSIERRATEVDEIVQHTCRLLAGMAQYPSVATPPDLGSTSLHRLYVSSPSPRHVLLVLLLSTGQVEHRLLDIGVVVTDRWLNRAGNYLNQLLAGISLEDLRKLEPVVVPQELHADSAIVEKIANAVKEAASDLSEERIFLEGTSHILRQREFQDVNRLEQVLSALEQHSLLCQVLGRALLGQDVTVIIGEEGTVEAIRECSVVTSSYRIGDRVCGFIGVVGPTRMNYDRAVGAVGFMSRNLSSLLTRHCLR